MDISIRRSIRLVGSFPYIYAKENTDKYSLKRKGRNESREEIFMGEDFLFLFCLVGWNAEGDRQKFKIMDFQDLTISHFSIY